MGKFERPASVNGQRTLSPFHPDGPLSEMDVALALAQVLTLLHEPGGQQVGLRWDDERGEVVYEIRQGSGLRRDLREVSMVVNTQVELPSPPQRQVDLTVPATQRPLDRSWILEPEAKPEGDEFITGWLHPLTHPRFEVFRIGRNWYARTGRGGGMRPIGWSAMVNYRGDVREGRQCVAGLRSTVVNTVDRCLLPDDHEGLHAAYGDDGSPFLYFANMNPLAVADVTA